MFVPSVEGARITIELLNDYKHDETMEDALDPKYQMISPEEFLEKHFAENDYSEELQVTVAEFFFRISKYRKYLEIIANQFVKSKSRNWKDKGEREILIYIVFLYLLVIELNEFTRGKIEEILISISDRKALAILTFFKRKDILTKLYEWGCQIWDVDYVTNLLKNAISDPAKFEEVYQTVAGHFERIKKGKSKALTIPIGPKCLSRPKKSIVVSSGGDSICRVSRITRIPVSLKAGRTPNTTYVKPGEIQKLEEERARNREEAKNLFELAQKKAFRCANPEKSEKFKESTRKIEEERSIVAGGKTKFKKIKTKDVPSPKKTAAVIIREGARLLKLEHEEIKRFEDLASGGFNGDLLAEWEEEIREENFRKHIEDIERKHLEGLLSYEEALLAKQKCLKKKKEQTDRFKKEKEIWTKQLEDWKREEQTRLQEAFEREKSLEKGVREAVEQVKEEKHKIALETTKESKALYEKRMKEREEDLQRKVQMIKEIKALQALGGIRRKQPNFYETANLGFLCEMSIAELKERLFILRIEFREEVEKRRAEIKMKRECRREIVETYKDLIESHRQVTQEQKKLLTGNEAEEDESFKKKKISRSSSCLEELRRKLYEKRRERFGHQIF